ncbi:MAG: 6-hydroxycyclohex-1-ene-1-carbonyl-CoA dehydrogenase [Myxococcales bacterium]
MSKPGFAWVFEGAGRPMARRDRVLPSPVPGHALVEVLGCGLCHTDLGYARGEVPTRKGVPLVLGHEVVGRVVEAGAGGEALLGRPVLVPAVMPCGKCAFCLAGRGNACPEQQMPGNDIDGGFASHLDVRVEPLVPLDMPTGFELWKLGVVADAVSTAYQAVRRAGLGQGDAAVVVGSGGVGGFVAQIAKALGARVLALDTQPARLALVARYGADQVLQVGPDAKATRTAVRAFCKTHGVPSLRLRIFECSGSRAGQQLAFGLLDRAATYVQVGYTPETVEIRLSNAMAFDATIVGTWGCPPDAYPPVLDLVARGAVTLDPFVERAPMSQLDAHLAAMHDGRLARRLVLDPTA